MQLPVLRDEDNDRLRKYSYSIIYIAVFLTIILVARLFFLQIYSNHYYSDLSENNYIRLLPIYSERGYIYDTNGELLVANQPSFSLLLPLTKGDAARDILNRVNKTVPINMTAALKSVEGATYFYPATIVKGLNFTQISYFYEHKDEYPELIINNEGVRKYFYPESMTHILGYVGEVSRAMLSRSDKFRSGDSIGVNGMESYYDEVLRGVDGAMQVRVDSRGRRLGVLSRRDPIQGADIHITLDAKLQQYTHNLMEDRGEMGAVVVMNISDGSLLTMVSAPTYNLEKFTPMVDTDYLRTIRNQEGKPFINRAISSAYPPGSVFKLWMLAGALNDNSVTPDTLFNCRGVFSYSRTQSYFCWRRSGHGDISAASALEESCDVYFYNLGLTMGIDNMNKYATNYGFGAKTGVDLPSERQGFFPSRKWKEDRGGVWFPGESIITSIGQGYITSTPLQITASTAALFNGGNVYTPHIFKEAVMPEIDERYEPQEITLNLTYPRVSRVVEGMSNESIEVVREGMRLVSNGNRGTARGSKPRGVIIGGKTGTSQVVSLEAVAKYKKDEIPFSLRDHGWFVAIAPVDDPKYVITVFAEHGRSGAGTAAPIARRVINKMVELDYFREDDAPDGF